ncbi:hypothetical protein BKA80DRAFT_143753 [Phyllosticta citrichinensis]
MAGEGPAGPLDRMVQPAGETNPNPATESSERRPTPSEVLAEIVSRRGFHGPPDLKITTNDGQEFHVHKDVLRPRSSFFRAAMDGPFKEAVSGILPLHNDPPGAVAALLQFVYTGDYELFYPEQYSWDGFFHLDVYVIGDLYNIDSLIRRGTHWFKEACRERQSDSTLSLLLEVVPYIYAFIPEGAADRGIHNYILELAKDNLDHLIKDLEFLDLLKEVDTFRISLASHKRRASARLHAHVLELQGEITKKDTLRYGCPNCRHWMTSQELRDLKNIYCPACKKIFVADACIISTT